MGSRPCSGDLHPCDGSDALVFLCSEEELLYLDFMENVTDEILKLGLFSNRLEIFFNVYGSWDVHWIFFIQNYLLVSY